MLCQADKLRDLALRALLAGGVDRGDAEVVTAALLEAELRGRPTHGLLRLPGIRFGRLGGALVVLSLTISALNSAVGAVRARSLATVFGLVSPTEYVTSRLGAYALAMQTVHELGPEAVVVSLWEPRGLYCWPTCLPDVWLDRWWEARQTLAEPTGILEAWKEQGITHVLLNRAGMDFIRAEDSRYSSQDWAVFQGLLDGLPPVARLGAGYELFLVPQ